MDYIKYSLHGSNRYFKFRLFCWKPFPVFSFVINRLGVIIYFQRQCGQRCVDKRRGRKAAVLNGRRVFRRIFGIIPRPGFGSSLNLSVDELLAHGGVPFSPRRAPVMEQNLSCDVIVIAVVCRTDFTKTLYAVFQVRNRVEPIEVHSQKEFLSGFGRDGIWCGTSVFGRFLDGIQKAPGFTRCNKSRVAGRSISSLQRLYAPRCIDKIIVLTR